MRTFYRSLSVVLTVLLLLSMVAVAPLTAGAAEVTGKAAVAAPSESAAPEETEGTDGAETVTVYFINTMNWSAVYINTWDPLVVGWPEEK